MAIATEAGYVVPMAVLKSSGRSAGKRAETPLSTALFLLPSQFLEFCRSLELLDRPSCFIDVENEVFEFDGQEIIFDNGANQLAAKAPGGI